MKIKKAKHTDFSPSYELQIKKINGISNLSITEVIRGKIWSIFPPLHYFR